jgi:transcription antitermination factor NusG
MSASAAFWHLVVKEQLKVERSCKARGEAAPGKPKVEKMTGNSRAIEPTGVSRSTDMSDPGNWYALYTCPRHEKSVAYQIEQRRIACFLPLYRSIRRWKDRRKELELALFPGYVFVRMALQERLRVLQIASVVHFVSVNGQPVALPESEIESLRDRLRGGVHAEPHPYLTVGRRVRVRSGPLAGTQGILLRRKEKCRLILSLNLIMRSVAVEVDEADVEPL